MTIFGSLLLIIIVALNVSYAYFWLVVGYARRKHHINRATVTQASLSNALGSARKHRHPYFFTVQITTKGGSLPTVLRGIRYIEEAKAAYPLLASLINVEVVTEVAGEAQVIAYRFPDVKTYVLPENYQTPKGTKLKARALHYMVERHRENPRNGYVVHYDEESLFTTDNLARLVQTLLLRPIGISEGTISYGLDWADANAICRTLESNRPFGCHECYLMMTHPVPLHLHGSNLVIQERIENEIGWDIGTYQGHSLIAEDLVFGLMAYLKYGKSVFGWHGVEMIEQPPFTLKAAYKQRERWVMGALQGVAHVKALPGWGQLSFRDRLKVQLGIKLRVLTYALGLPVSLVSLLVWSGVGITDAILSALGAPMYISFSLWAIPGLVMWLGSNQLGLAQNLRFLSLSWRERANEHLLILLLTPLAGLFDTAGPFMAVAKWTIGRRGVSWTPTPKLVKARTT